MPNEENDLSTKFRLWPDYEDDESNDNKPKGENVLIHAKIREANKRAICVAKFPVRVLLLGATGTGKSMLARHIHYNSGRTTYKTICKKVWDGIKGQKLKEMLAWAAGKHKQDNSGADCSALDNAFKGNESGCELPSQTFREINLAALPEQTISSELFGYVDGAFTDANKHGSPGLFINANGGTLFLDEIADCPLSIQAKLLAVIQARDKEDGDCACYVIPNGQEEEVRVNVRLICATNKDLFDEVKAGRFREDLYYRLKEYEIKLPSLSELIPIGTELDPPKNERLGEKYYLLTYINHVLSEVNTKLYEAESGSDGDAKYIKKVLSDGARNILKEYPFPGNYRELQSCLTQACLNARTRFIMCSDEDGEEIIAKDLPDEIQGYDSVKMGIVEDYLRRDLQNEDEVTKAKKLFREMERSGWCTTADLTALCKIDGFKFAIPVSGKKEKDKESERGYDPVCMRNLCYLIYLIKMDKANTAVECAGELLGRSDQTLRQFLNKFGIKFDGDDGVKKVIRELYGLKS